MTWLICSLLGRGEGCECEANTNLQVNELKEQRQNMFVHATRKDTQSPGRHCYSKVETCRSAGQAMELACSF
jgi:hypothetical protein